MSEINANIVISPIDLGVTVNTNQLTFTPDAINMSIYSGGLSAIASGLDAPIANVHITGGSNGYYLQTDGTGNLDWAQYANANYLDATISNVHISGGTNGYVLQTDGTGNLDWTAMTGGGGNGTPGGANTQVQYNDNGSFGGNVGFTFNEVTGNLNVPGNVTAPNFVGNLSGSVTTAAQGNITSVGTLTSITTSSNNIALGNVSNSITQGVSIGYGAGAVNPGDDAIAIGDGAGGQNQGDSSTAVGPGAGRYDQGANSIAIGFRAGNANQGINSIAIGTDAGNNAQSNNTIILNATGANLTAATANAFYVKPIRNTSTANLLFYNNSTGEISYDVLSNSLVANTANFANFAGIVTTAAQPNITSLGTLTGLGVNGTITGVNITANTGVFSGNGSSLTALNASNVSTGTLAQARLANASVTLGSTALTLGSTVTTVTGLTSVTSTTFVGALTGAATSAGSATTAGTVTTAAQPNITSVGTLNSLTATNITTANIGNTSSFLYFPVAGGNFYTVVNGAPIQYWNWGAGANTGSNINGYLIASGNITGNYFVGNGSRLTSIAGANVTGTVSNANIAGTVTTNAQPNITSVGTLTSLAVTGALTANGNVTVGTPSIASNLLVYGNIKGGAAGNFQLDSTTGNIQAFNFTAFTGGFYGAATGLTSIPGGNVTGAVPLSNDAVTANNANYAGNVTVAAQGNITSLGTLTSLLVTGNTSSGNIISNNYVKAHVFVTANIGSAVTLGVGALAFVSDATSTTFRAAYTGGGGNASPVFSDGTVWRIG